MYIRTYLHGPGYVCFILVLRLQWVHSMVMHKYVMHCMWLMYFRPAFLTSAQCHASLLLKGFFTNASHGRLLRRQHSRILSNKIAWWRGDCHYYSGSQKHTLPYFAPWSIAWNWNRYVGLVPTNHVELSCSANIWHGLAAQQGIDCRSRMFQIYFNFFKFST